MSLFSLNVSPRPSVNDRQDHLLRDTVLLGQFERAEFSDGVGAADSPHVVLSEFGTRIVLSLKSLGMFLVMLAQTIATLLFGLLCVCSVPGFSSASVLRMSVSAIVLACAFVSTSTTFGIAVGVIISRSSREQMIRPYALGIVACVAAVQSWLLSVFQEVRDSMNQVRLEEARPTQTSPAVPVSRESSLPLPTFATRAKPWFLAYKAPKGVNLESAEWRYFSNAVWHCIFSCPRLYSTAGRG